MAVNKVQGLVELIYRGFVHKVSGLVKSGNNFVHTVTEYEMSTYGCKITGAGYKVA